MNKNKRKKMLRLGLFNEKATKIVEEVKPVEPQPLPVALKELPVEVPVEPVTEVVQEEVQSQPVEKKKVTKNKKVVEEDTPSDV